MHGSQAPFALPLAPPIYPAAIQIIDGLYSGICDSMQPQARRLRDLQHSVQELKAGSDEAVNSPPWS